MGEKIRFLVRRIIAFLPNWIVLFLVFAAPQGITALAAGTWILDEDSSNVLTRAWVGRSVPLLIAQLIVST